MKVLVVEDCIVCSKTAKMALVGGEDLLGGFCSRACLFKWLMDSNNLLVKWPAKEEKT